MVTADMTRAIRIGTMSVAGLTLIGALAAAIHPALGPGTRPHPALTPSLATAISIWQSNLRVLAAPFILAALRFADSHLWRAIGDLLVAAITGYSTLTVGLALGRWGATLVPYLPNLPAEWAALSLAVVVWLLARKHALAGSGLAALAVTIAVLLAAAAALETWATPVRVDTSRNLTALAIQAGARSPGEHQ
jgi:hypothetical protein